jgi:hypothetical protein
MHKDREDAELESMTVCTYEYTCGLAHTFLSWFALSLLAIGALLQGRGYVKWFTCL